MTSIAELEHRLTLAQEATSAAAACLKYREEEERRAVEALTNARIEAGEM